ncbi:hypothetical protein [Mesobaculum littorinae]|uniref:hypothetical protein n=1 Tax=Mesobaculum littorinae TaxID=2486419 RepID=UPI0013E37500|nr:hypothetical protein [Mesobaculum littorinae]
MAIDRPRLFALAAAALVTAIFVAANVHLVSVSLSSQPTCIATKEGAGHHRPAKPSC